MIGWLKDPVTSFVIAGTAIFLLSGLFSDSESTRVIELSDADFERLSGNWQMQRGRAPDSEEMHDIVGGTFKTRCTFANRSVSV